jgi:hypothetical protein
MINNAADAPLHDALETAVPPKLPTFTESGVTTGNFTICAF